MIFHKCSFSFIILKFSVKLYSDSREKIRWGVGVSYSTQCNGKMSGFSQFKIWIFFHELPPINDCFKQVIKCHHRFFFFFFFCPFKVPFEHNWFVEHE